MDTHAHMYAVSAEGIPTLTLLSDGERMTVASGEITEVVVRLQADSSKLDRRSTEVLFVLRADDAPRIEVKERARFLGPGVR